MLQANAEDVKETSCGQGLDANLNIIGQIK
jgi:hypothetical protein